MLSPVNKQNITSTVIDQSHCLAQVFENVILHKLEEYLRTNLVLNLVTLELIYV